MSDYFGTYPLSLRELEDLATAEEGGVVTDTVQQLAADLTREAQETGLNWVQELADRATALAGERSGRSVRQKPSLGCHPRHGEAALGDLEPWQMEALAADLRHLFATGRNPQLDDLDDLCPHFEGTCDRCGRPATYWSLPVDPTDDPMPQHTPPEDCPQHDDDDHTDAWSTGYTAGAKDRSAELARDLYGLADLIREQHLAWEATYDNIRRAADHYRKEGTQ